MIMRVNYPIEFFPMFIFFIVRSTINRDSARLIGGYRHLLISPVLHFRRQRKKELISRVV
jgi:hypothetical protein